MRDFAYEYLTKLTDHVELYKIFKDIISFIKDGFYPQHIYENTLRYYDAFGRDGFL